MSFNDSDQVISTSMVWPSMRSPAREISNPSAKEPDAVCVPKLETFSTENASLVTDISAAYSHRNVTEIPADDVDIVISPRSIVPL